MYGMLVGKGCDFLPQLLGVLYFSHDTPSVELVMELAVRMEMLTM